MSDTVKHRDVPSEAPGCTVEYRDEPGVVPAVLDMSETAGVHRESPGSPCSTGMENVNRDGTVVAPWYRRGTPGVVVLIPGSTGVDREQYFDS